MKVIWSVPVILIAFAALLAAAECRGQEHSKATVWLGGPLVLQFNGVGGGGMTLGLGMGPVLVSRESRGYYSSSETVIEIGPMLEGMYYFGGRPNGLAACLRAGSAGGSGYFAPGVFYVSKPRGAISGRIGLMFPLGSNVEPVLPELSIGFNF